MNPEQGAEQAYDVSQPFLEQVRTAVDSTREHPSEFIEYRSDGAYRDGGDRWKRDSADTIGTKADLHWQARTFEAAAQDAFAMNANDLYRDRVVPYKLLNTLMIEREDGEAISGIIKGLADLSRERGIQMGDGETAILNTMHGFELDVTMTGVVIDERPNRYRSGNVLIGIPSSGIHSNGLTDARRLYGETWPRELLVPTRIYDEIPSLIQEHEIHGLTHVTGGGFTKLRTAGLDMILDPVEKPSLPPSFPMFHDLYQRWLGELRDARAADIQMYRKFNNGYGFVVGVPKKSAEATLAFLPDARIIGRVISGKGAIVISSHYTGRTITI